MIPRPPPPQGEELEPSPPAVEDDDDSTRKLSPERHQLVESYLGYAKNLARSYCRAQPSHSEEFLSAAYLGLVRAARDYDPLRKTTFATFARVYVTGELNNAWRKLIPSGYRHATPEERATAPSSEPLSVHSEREGRVLFGSPEPAPSTRIEEREAFETWLRHVNRTQARILRGLFLDAKSFAEIAEELNLTIRSVSTIKQAALSILNDIAYLRLSKFSDPTTLEKPPCASASSTSLRPPRSRRPRN